LDGLLRRPDINAVSIAVSISVSPSIIQKALAAGKHILSEKPIAPTVSIAKQLLADYRTRSTLWAVGENFRFWKSVERASGVLRELNAKVLTFRCVIHHFIGPEDKYFHTDWYNSSSRQSDTANKYSQAPGL
jgi:predicted dehydrogenase